MLIKPDEQVEGAESEQAVTPIVNQQIEEAPCCSGSGRAIGLSGRVLRIEWLGQTLASVCWIVSVFCYGIESAGDWLQLAAASAWLVANIAAVASPTQAE
jgi:hypothetical protein